MSKNFLTSTFCSFFFCSFLLSGTSASVTYFIIYRHTNIQVVCTRDRRLLVTTRKFCFRSFFFFFFFASFWLVVTMVTKRLGDQFHCVLISSRLNWSVFSLSVKTTKLYSFPVSEQRGWSFSVFVQIKNKIWNQTWFVCSDSYSQLIFNVTDFSFTIYFMRITLNQMKSHTHTAGPVCFRLSTNCFQTPGQEIICELDSLNGAQYIQRRD